MLEGRKMERWSDMRNFFIQQALKYQTTMKLWDSQRKGGALYQKYPEFLKLTDFHSPSKRMELNVPDDEYLAKKQLRNLLKSVGITTDKYVNLQYKRLNGKDMVKISKGTSRILKLCSNVLPNKAFNMDEVDNNIR